MDIIPNMKQETVKSIIIATFQRFSTTGTRSALIQGIIHGITEVLKEDLIYVKTEEERMKLERTIININGTKRFSTGT